MRPESQDEPDGPDGRHRASRRVLAWAPGLADPPDEPEPAAARLDEPEPAAEPEPFAGIGLAATPVSVTPPRSWRKAAWFIVAASSVVLIVLVFAAIRLAGPEHRFGRLDAFPGLPTGGLLTPQPPPTEAPTDRSSGAPADTREGPAEPSAGPGGGPGTALSTEGAPPQGPEQPGQGHGGQTESPPTVNTAPPPEQPLIDTEQLLGATQQFFGLLPENIDAAWHMLSPRVRGQGYEGFDKHWKKFRDVRLQDTMVDAEHSRVTAVVLVTGKNGRTATQRWTLGYRQAAGLVIDEAVLEDDGGFDE